MTPITLEVLEAVRTVLADGEPDGTTAPQDDVVPAPAAVVPAPREPLARRRPGPDAA